MSRPDTIEDLKNDIESNEILMEEDKKKYLNHLKKQTSDIDEFFKKEESKTYFQQAVNEIESMANKVVSEPKIDEEKLLSKMPTIPADKKQSTIKKLWENFKKII